MKYELISPRDKTLPAVEQVLQNRGIQDIKHYLNTDDTDILDPSLIANIKEGAMMLVSHIKRESRVMVQIDSDADGYTSAAALLNYLNKLFPSFTQNNICYRPHTDKTHGLLLETIPDDVQLVIAPDSSSMDYEVHKALNEKGIDVLVIDHHEAEKVSEYACVINNQLCDYPTKSLSGVGMVYKFCCYLDQLIDTNYADDILDLVALGLIADMVDLRDYETKRLIEKGLENVHNPFFKGMAIKNEYSIGPEITPFGVGFYIAPFINAVARSGSPEDKLLLFEAMLEYKAYEIIPSTKRGCKGETETRVEQACRNCGNIKNRQTTVRDDSLEIIEQIIEEQDLLRNKVILVQLNEAQKTTLAGLIANQIMPIYGRPVLILSETKHEILDDNGIVVDVEKWWEGSGRGPNILGFEDCKAFYEESGLVEYVSGHANAFGLGIKDQNVEAFLEYVNTELADFDFTPRHKVDFLCNAKDIYDYHYDFYNLIDYSNLWGQQVSEPLVAIENIAVTKDNIDLMKGKTLKITLPGDPDISLIKFRVAEEEYEQLYSESGCVTLNVVGFCKRNSYNNKPQIIMKDYEIVRRMDYYF